MNGLHVFLVAAGAMAAQQAAPDWIDQIVQEEALSRGVPGLGLAIVAKGAVVAERTYGLADVERAVAVQPTTVFNIASLSKPFSAIAVLRLARRHAIGLDDPASSRLAWLPESLASITIRQLLTHTSGIVRDVRTGNADDPDGQEYQARIAKAEKSAEPGARWEYSNTGYAVLGWAAEAAAELPFDQLLAEEVFEVADMQQARYRTAVTESDRAQPYRWAGGVLELEQYVSGGFASGGIELSTRDLAAFALALQSDRLLTAEERQLAWSPARLGDGHEVRVTLMTDADSYGCGWFLSTYSGHRLVTHGGAIQGYSADLFHFPDDELTIAVVANLKARDDGQAPVDPIARRLANHLLAAPSPPPPPADDREAVRGVVLDYVEGIYEADPARIERSVDPAVAKLGFWRSRPGGPFAAESMTYAQLLDVARTYNAKGEVPRSARKKIEILDLLDQIAVVKLEAHWGVDYLHLAKRDGRWQIVHVLWQGPPPRG